MKSTEKFVKGVNDWNIALAEAKKSKPSDMKTLHALARAIMASNATEVVASVDLLGFEQSVWDNATSYINGVNAERLRKGKEVWDAITIQEKIRTRLPLQKVADDRNAIWNTPEKLAQRAAEEAARAKEAARIEEIQARKRAQDEEDKAYLIESVKKETNPRAWAFQEDARAWRWLLNGELGTCSRAKAIFYACKDAYFSNGAKKNHFKGSDFYDLTWV